MTWKLWLDDYRFPPDDTWCHVLTSGDAVEFLKNNKVEHLSLDYDLGETQREKIFAGDGGDVVNWLAENENKRPFIVSLHSRNADGRFYMMSLLLKMGYVEATRWTIYPLPISRGEWMHYL